MPQAPPSARPDDLADPRAGHQRRSQVQRLVPRVVRLKRPKSQTEVSVRPLGRGAPPAFSTSPGCRRVKSSGVPARSFLSLPFLLARSLSSNEFVTTGTWYQGRFLSFESSPTRRRPRGVASGPTAGLPQVGRVAAVHFVAGIHGHSGTQTRCEEAAQTPIRLLGQRLHQRERGGSDDWTRARRPHLF